MALVVFQDPEHLIIWHCRTESIFDFVNVIILTLVQTSYTLTSDEQSMVEIEATELIKTRLLLTMVLISASLSAILCAVSSRLAAVFAAVARATFVIS